MDTNYIERVKNNYLTPPAPPTTPNPMELIDKILRESGMQVPQSNYDYGRPSPLGPQNPGPLRPYSGPESRPDPRMDYSLHSNPGPNYNVHGTPPLEKIIPQGTRYTSPVLQGLQTGGSSPMAGIPNTGPMSNIVAPPSQYGFDDMVDTDWGKSIIPEGLSAAQAEAQWFNTGPEATGAGGGGWMSKIPGMFGEGTTWSDIGGAVTGGAAAVGNIAQAWNAFKSIDMAKDMFKFQKDAFNTQLGDNRKTYNTSVERRADARARGHDWSDQKRQDFIDRNKLG